MRKWFLVLALLGLSTQARAGTYVLQCALAQGCVAIDGTTQPLGTYLQKIRWDGASPYHPAGMNVVLYTNQTIYIPITPAVTTLPVMALFNRFTTAEFNGLMANAAAAGIIAKINAYGANALIYNADPIILGYMAQAVSAGLITSARATQILDFAIASP